MMLNFCSFVISLLLTKKAYCCDQTLPVIDLTSPDAAENLVDAFQSFGFSYIKGHSVDEEIIKNAEDQAKRFFRLPPRFVIYQRFLIHMDS